jgi:hypothetical protein
MLNINDSVKIVKDIGIRDAIGKTATIITVPDSYSPFYKIKIDGKRLFYNATENQLELITIINSEKPMTAKKTVCEINFTRQGGEQLLFIKTTKEIADLFKSEAGTSISDNYLDKDGNKLKYQIETPKLQIYASKFKQQSYSLNCKLDRYGTDLIIEGYYNFSILRTKDIQNGVTVKVGDLILENDVTNWVQSLGAFLKFLHRNYIDKVEVKATITMDL